MPLKLALAVRETVAGHRLRVLEGEGRGGDSPRIPVCGEGRGGELRWGWVDLLCLTQPPTNSYWIAPTQRHITSKRCGMNDKCNLVRAPAAFVLFGAAVWRMNFMQCGQLFVQTNQRAGNGQCNVVMCNVPLFCACRVLVR